MLGTPRALLPLPGQPAFLHTIPATRSSPKSPTTLCCMP